MNDFSDFTLDLLMMKKEKREPLDDNEDMMKTRQIQRNGTDDAKMMEDERPADVKW